MAPAPSYLGPVALGYSKYADPQNKKVALATMPLAVTSPVSATTDSTIATKEQIAAAHDSASLETAPQNPDAQLAVARGNDLKDEVDKSAARFSRAVSSAVTNTRRLLELIRESMQKHDMTDLTSVENLWTELEQLFAAANNAKTALPAFLEKQRDNMSLYYASMMNETIRETQEELNIQHKKVNIQHNLILEHQGAFQDYKAQNENKFKELEDMKERLSRLTLEKGNLRTEIDKYKQLLEKEKLTRSENLQQIETLQKDLVILISTKQQLLVETKNLRNALTDLQEKTKAVEKQATARFAAELASKNDELQNEAKKTTSLNAIINVLKGGEHTVKMELDKLKLENRTLKEKYDHQAAEHADAFTKLNTQTKRIDTLTNDVGRFQKENAEMKLRLPKLVELDKENQEHVQAKSNLLEQVGKLTTELSTVKKDGDNAKTQLDVVLQKLAKLDREMDNLETEKKGLLSTHAEARKATQVLQDLKVENLKLGVNIDELRGNQIAPAVSDRSKASGHDTEALEATISGLEEDKAKLEKSLQEWTDLAKRSYKEYKEMLPTFKQAKEMRKEALDKDDVIKGLKLELSAAKALQSNGVGVGVGPGPGDAAHWKEKYETLLSNYGS